MERSVLFGAPIAHEDHASRACFAAIELRDSARDYAEGLRLRDGLEFAVRIGLHSGEVVAGVVGSYTVVRHGVGMAQRMEGLAAPGEICRSEQTATIVRHDFTLRDGGMRGMKGVRGLQRVFVLERATPTAAGESDAATSRLSPFVGRESEMARLVNALEQLTAGDGRVMRIVADDAGAGKSRLCQEFAEYCRRRQIRVEQGRAVPYGRAVPLVPAHPLIQEVAYAAQLRPTRERSHRAVAEALTALHP